MDLQLNGADTDSLKTVKCNFLREECDLFKTDIEEKRSRQRRFNYGLGWGCRHDTGDYSWQSTNKQRFEASAAGEQNQRRDIAPERARRPKNQHILRRAWFDQICFLEKKPSGWTEVRKRGRVDVRKTIRMPLQQSKHNVDLIFWF